MIETNNNGSAEILANIFRFQAGIFKNAISDLNDEVVRQRPSDRTNHLNWILGHIIHCRFMLGSMIGLNQKNPFGNMYWEPIQNQTYPDIQFISAAFNKVDEALSERISAITMDEMNGSAAIDKPKLAEVVSFFSYHEAYHLGQIGYVRKLIGLPALKSH